jgi:hypothetical protein
MQTNGSWVKCGAISVKMMRWGYAIAFLSALLICTDFMVSPAMGQTGGQGGIQGTVTDSTGAVVPDVVVVATNQATGVATTRKSSSAGLFEIIPVIPGTYTVTAKVNGFQTYKQENLTVDALKVTGLNIALTIGTSDQTVTVSSAPPALETTNATLGGVMENDTYQNLPLVLNGQQRDPTAFATLLPGAQGGARTPIIGGTGNYLAEISVDGIPITTSNQQGDNRPVSNSVPVDAVDQFQVLTSTLPVEYQGAGLLNFTIKSGGSHYHGTVADFVRNTIFDTWGFSAPALTEKNLAGETVQAPKPVEHQNELVATFGGPVPYTKKKLFFFTTYDRYHGRNGINPNNLTIPTTLMRTGDFTELDSSAVNGVSGTNAILFDPTTNVCGTSGCTRTPFQYVKNGLPSYNIIPPSELSPIAKYMAQYLPDPTNSQVYGNYLGGVPSGYDNWEVVGRVDADITPSQRISYVLTTGSRHTVPFTVGNNGIVLPFPYTNGTYATVKPTIMTLEHTFTINSHIVNQARFGFVNMGGPPIQNLTQGVKGYQATDAGITNLPPGQASEQLPGAAFSASTAFPTAETTFGANGASGATQTSVSNTYTILDNLEWTKGRHNFTFGFQYQFLQDNASTYDGPSGVVTATYTPNDTANFTSGSQSLNSPNTGFAYASYLLGAVGTTGTTIQSYGVLGGRYRPFAPYAQDDWRVTEKLTLNLGLRWDLLTPYVEAKDRWSFLNPTLTNPLTGNPGALQFAGNAGPLSCNCRTPVHTYYKNFGPRLGLAYSADDKTVFRAGFAIVYSHAGGVGGRAGAGNGTGQLGFSTGPTFSETSTGAAAGPAFYLNDSAAFQARGLSNTAYGGPGYVLPTPPGISQASVGLDTGNYLDANGNYVTATSAPGYADPIISGRAPTFNFYNVGMQRAITNDLTISANYAGSQSHFIATGSNARGYWVNQLNPTYLAALGSVADSTGKTPVLNAAATAANIAIVQNALSGYNVPYSAFAQAATKSTKATIAQSLVAFPQYSSVSDTWGLNTGNVSYNSLQISLAQRPWHGLSYTMNYTYSKNIGDDNTFRSGFDIPAAASSAGVATHQDRADRSWTTTSVPENLSLYGVYQLPFGKGKIGSNSWLVRTLAGGWQASGVLQYTSGVPLAITASSCTSPGQGQCTPDLNPAYLGQNVRINGKWGSKDTAATLGKTPYISVAGFQTPGYFANPAFGANQLTKIGDAPRTYPYQLRGPSTLNGGNLGIRRSFNLTPERVRLIFQADCFDVANHNTKGTINQAWGATSTTFGSVSSASGNRDFQFAGRVNF